jgi:hypothetical protein
MVADPQSQYRLLTTEAQRTIHSAAWIDAARLIGGLAAKSVQRR